jgi:hypothetical protein
MQLAASANDDVALGIAVGSRGGGTVHGGTCDVRAALLLLLIGKCNAYQAALDEVGGEEFFRYFPNISGRVRCGIIMLSVRSSALESQAG